MNNILAMKRIRQAMTALSFLLVLYTAGVMLAGSLHIVESGESSSFLQSIPHAPSSPWMVFWLCFILCSLLSWLILNTVQGSKSGILLCAGFKTLLACIIIWNVNLSCRPLLLLVFSDVLYTMRGFQARYMVGIGSILTGLYLLFSYEVITPMIPMVSTGVYFSVFEHSTSSLLAFGQSLLESATLVLFIAFMCEFLIDLHQEKENIAQELNMMNRVNEDLRHYAQMTEQIAEIRERKRLAREIHDTLGHALTGIAAGVDATLIIIDKSPEVAKKQLTLVSQVVREGISDVRNSLEKLRPGALDQVGLKGALQKMITEFTGLSSSLVIDLNYEVDQADFEVAKEDALFRVVQESITNSIRHGAATHIYIHFFIEDSFLLITIEDNGFGAHSIKPGYGLIQMKERIAAIHGTIAFDGSDGFLTRIRIPLQEGEFHD